MPYFLVSVQTASNIGPANVPSLEMCIVNVVTMLDSNLASSYIDRKEQKDGGSTHNGAAWNESDFYELIAQLHLILTCEAKQIALYKLQTSKIAI